jgi:hypothetical protein
MPGTVETSQVARPEAPFKVCTLCGKGWQSREDFIGDPEAQLVGYQAHFQELTEGFFLFNHMRSGCGSTIAIAVKHFVDLYSGPVFETQLRGGPSCPGFCLHTRALNPCPQKCECSFVRGVIQVIRAWPKRSAA